MRMTFETREEFLAELWEDYLRNKQDITRCFYYKYLENKKNNRAAADFSDFADKEQLMQYLEAVCKKPRIKDKYNVLYGVRSVCRKLNITNEEFAGVFTRLTGGNSSEKNVFEASRMYEKELLKGCVRDFFCNEGFKARDGSKKESGGKRKERNGYTDMIEMINEYDIYIGNETVSDEPAVQTSVSDPGGALRISSDYKMKCTVLYTTLLRLEKACRIVVPLCFDPASGAGLFIIGKSILKTILPGDELKKIPVNSSVCIVSFAGNAESEPDAGYALNMAMSIEPCEIRTKTAEQTSGGKFFSQNTVDVRETIKRAFIRFEKKLRSTEYFKGYSEFNSNTISAEEFVKGNIDKIFISRLFDETGRAEKISRRDRILQRMSAIEQQEIAAVRKEKMLEQQRKILPVQNKR